MTERRALPVPSVKQGASERLPMRADVLAPLAVFLLALASAPVWAQWQSNGTPVCTAPFNQLTPFIQGDGVGGAMVAWADQRDSATTDFDIYMQHIDVTGQVLWELNGIPVCVKAGIQEMPHLTLDGSGGVIVAWNDYGVVPAGVRVQRIDPQGARMWTPLGVAASATSVYHRLTESHYPCIVSDDHGGAIVAYGQRTTGTNTEIYAQRIDSTGTLLWGPTGVPVCTAPSFQLYPTLVADGAGGAIVTWEDFRNYPTGHIYAQRLGPDGSPLWATNGIMVSRAGGDQRSPVIVSDGAEGAIVANEDYPQARIYAQRVSAIGSLLWGPDGVLISTIVPIYFPFIVSDESGGAVVSFKQIQATPTGSTSDAFAQRLDAGGTLLWGLDGTIVSDAQGGQAVWGLASDMAGGAIAVWGEGREDHTDTFVQHLQASGTAQWRANGIPIVEGSTWTFQFRHIADSDGADGAVLAWEDSRNGFWWASHRINFDIYATRVTTDAEVVDTSAPSPTALRILSAWPNPSAGGMTISYALPSASSVTIEVFDITGARVRVLVSDLVHRAGTRSIEWDGRDSVGRRVAAGVYMVRLEAGSRVASRRVALLE